MLAYLSALRRTRAHFASSTTNATLRWLLEQARRRRAGGSLHAAVVRTHGTHHRLVPLSSRSRSRRERSSVRRRARRHSRRPRSPVLSGDVHVARSPRPAGSNRGTSRRCPTTTACFIVAVRGCCSTRTIGFLRSFETEDALFSRLRRRVVSRLLADRATDLRLADGPEHCRDDCANWLCGGWYTSLLRSSRSHEVAARWWIAHRRQYFVLAAGLAASSRTRSGRAAAARAIVSGSTSMRRVSAATSCRDRATAVPDPRRRRQSA